MLVTMRLVVSAVELTLPVFQGSLMLMMIVVLTLPLAKVAL